MVKANFRGLLEPVYIQAVNEAQADIAGFVFAKSRHVASLAIALAL